MKHLTLTLQSCISRIAKHKIQEQTLIAILFFQSRQTESHRRSLVQHRHLSALTHRHRAPSCKTFRKIPRGGRRQRMCPRSTHSSKPTLNIPSGTGNVLTAGDNATRGQQNLCLLPQKTTSKHRGYEPASYSFIFAFKMSMHPRKHTAKHKMLSTDSASELRAFPIPAWSYL